MAEKVAIFLFTGPDAPCRVMHAFIFARDIRAKGSEASIVLEGEAPGWLLALPNPEHKLHGMYEKVKSEGLIVAVCRACATQAGAVEETEKEGFPLVGDAFGHVSLLRYLTDGYRIVTL